MKLVYLNGESSGRSFELVKPKTSIGRETDNDIQLMVGGVSRYHAVFEFEGSDWILRDLGSTNGTNLNGLPIDSPRKVTSGDTVVIGDQRFSLNDDSENAPPPQLGGTTFVFRPPAAAQDNVSESIRPDSVTTTRPAPDAVFLRPPQAKNVPSESSQSGASQNQAQQPPQVPPSPPAVVTPEQSYAQAFNDDIFKSKDDKNSYSSNDGDHKKKGKHSSLRSNIIFGLLILLLAAVVLFIFVIIKQDDVKDTPSESGDKVPVKTETANPFVLRYERMLVDGTSVFKFTMLVEDEELTIMLDDIRPNGEETHRRKHYNTMKISEAYMDELKKAMDESKFFKAAKLPLPGQKSYRRIIGGYGEKFNDIAVENPNESKEFLYLERELENFISANYIPGLFLTQEENFAEAMKIYETADLAYQSCNNNPKPYNIFSAINDFKQAEKMFRLFTPPPKEYDEIRPKLAEAEKLLADIEKDHQFRISRDIQQRKYDAAIETCKELLKYYESKKSSSEYREVYKQLSKLYDAKNKRERR